MVDRNDRNFSQNEHTFIKETIKEPPINKKRIAEKLVLASACGIAFGVCAVFTVMLLYPRVFRNLDNSCDTKVAVTITPSEKKTDTEEKTSAADVSVLTEKTERTENTVQSRILEASKEPRKALVRVESLSEDTDFPDGSFLNNGDEEGIVFLKNDDAFYILTVSRNEKESEKYRVTFSNDSSADGILCKKDARTGFMVLRVPAESLDSADIKEIPAASLDLSGKIEQMQPVIAIGSPEGNYDSLVSGTVTSVSGRLETADEEYTLFSTDMVGSDEGDGVILNLEGKVIGVICQPENELSDVIRAVPVSQISSLLETLANRQKICYIGIQGLTISKVKSANLEIPRGIYVNSVEENSPAMTAGIQSGDIVHKLGNTEIVTMEEYSGKLQSIKVGTRTTIDVYRRNPSGEYVDVSLNISIKEK